MPGRMPKAISFENHTPAQWPEGLPVPFRAIVRTPGRDTVPQGDLYVVVESHVPIRMERRSADLPDGPAAVFTAAAAGLPQVPGTVHTFHYRANVATPSRPKRLEVNSETFVTEVRPVVDFARVKIHVDIALGMDLSGPTDVLLPLMAEEGDVLSLSTAWKCQPSGPSAFHIVISLVNTGGQGQVMRVLGAGDLGLNPGQSLPADVSPGHSLLLHFAGSGTPHEDSRTFGVSIVHPLRGRDERNYTANLTFHFNEPW